MRRPDLLTLIGGAAAAWPLAARAQQPTMPVIGYLGSGSDASVADNVAPLRLGLSETGWVEGRNLAIEFRWAENQYERLPGLAAELVGRRVNAIVAVGSPLPARAAKAATATIPIVFAYGGDPVNDGLVASFNRPGGNVTGVTFITAALAPKRLELLRELVPGTDLIGVLANPTSPLADVQWKNLQAAAGPIRQRLLLVNASRIADFETAFTNLVQQRAGALLVTTDGLFFAGRTQLAALAARHRIPWTGTAREYALEGSLLSYGARFADTYRQAGVYAGRILKGDKPADLPVMQPTKFELIVNLKAAKALGLTIPESFLLRADEVIE
jgi:putative ABC transport system substrate-binding protein